jgi:hypothetical protein
MVHHSFVVAVSLSLGGMCRLVLAPAFIVARLA